MASIALWLPSIRQGSVRVCVVVFLLSVRGARTWSGRVGGRGALARGFQVACQPRPSQPRLVSADVPVCRCSPAPGQVSCFHSKGSDARASGGDGSTGREGSTTGYRLAESGEKRALQRQSVAASRLRVDCADSDDQAGGGAR